MSRPARQHVSGRRRESDSALLLRWQDRRRWRCAPAGRRGVCFRVELQPLRPRSSPGCSMALLVSPAPWRSPEIGDTFQLLGPAGRALPQAADRRRTWSPPRFQLRAGGVGRPTRRELADRRRAALGSSPPASSWHRAVDACRTSSMRKRRRCIMPSSATTIAVLHRRDRR